MEEKDRQNGGFSSQKVEVRLNEKVILYHIVGAAIRSALGLKLKTGNVTYADV